MDKELSDEILKRLQKEVENEDVELAHGRADGLLCEMLARLGYHNVVEKFNEVPKWYA